MLKVVAPLLLVFSLCLSCQRDIPVTPEPSTGNVLDYYPLTKGSMWVNRHVSGSNVIFDTMVVVNDTLIDGVNHHVVRSRGGIKTAVKVDDNGNVVLTIMYKFSPDRRFHILHGVPKLGDTWTFDDKAGATSMDRYNMAVTSIDTLVTVEGRTYDHAVSISALVNRTSSSGSSTYTGKLIFVKNVGLVFTEYTGISRATLVSYDIK